MLGRTGELPAVGQPANPGGNPAELFHVDVQQAARVAVLVADLAVPARANQLAGDPIHLGQPRQLLSTKYRPDRGGSHAELRGEPDRRHAASRSETMLATAGSGVSRASVCGRDERSPSPASPSAR